MRRIPALILICALLLTFAACGAEPAQLPGLPQSGAADAAETAGSQSPETALPEETESEESAGGELYESTFVDYETFLADKDADKTAAAFRPYADSFLLCAAEVPECAETLERMAVDALERIPEIGPPARVPASRQEAAQLALHCLAASHSEKAEKYTKLLTALTEDRPCDAVAQALELKEQGDDTFFDLFCADSSWLEAFANLDHLASALSSNAAKVQLRSDEAPRTELTSSDFSNRNLLFGPVEMIGNNVYSGYDRSCRSLRISYGELMDSLKGSTEGKVLVIHCWQDVPRGEEPHCRADFRTMSFLPDELFPSDLSQVEYLLEADYDYYEGGTYTINRGGVRDTYPAMSLRGSVRVIRLSDGEEIFTSGSVRGSMPNEETYSCGGNFVCGSAPEMGPNLLEAARAILQDRG